MFVCSQTHARPTVFSHVDWSIGCDNTGRCEAVGHQNESDEHAIAMSITRDTGPGTPLRVQLILQAEDAGPAHVTVQAGRNRLASVPTEQDLPSAQVAALLPWMLNEKVLLASSGKQTWRLSLSGLKAVLLKMDEAQGRLDTPEALVRKGTRPESAVPAPAAGPRLVAEPVPDTRPSDEKQLPAILKALPASECQPDLDINLTRLSRTKLLVMRECGRGAYQSSWEMWAANDKPPYAPARLKFPRLNGASDTELLISPVFDDGVLRSYAKGRGINDCGESVEYLWTAAGFQLMSMQKAIMCRGIPGGVPVSLWTASVAGKGK